MSDADRLKGATIVYFGPEPWAGLWRNRHQLMSRFAADNDVWYVEPPTMVRHLPGVPGRGPKRRRPLRHRLVHRDPCGVNVFQSPWWLPLTGREPLRRWTLRMYFRVLGRVTGLRRAKRGFAWLSRPAMLDYVEWLRPAHIVYHVVDEYSGYGQRAGDDSGEPDPREFRLLEAADTVIVVTDTLHERKSPYNANTHVVANAVDFEAYATDGLAVPVDMQDLPHPVIGYSGLIAARLDLEMLRAAALARPDWSFVLVGTVNTDNCESQIAALRTLPNVHFPGQQPVGDVPAWVAQFDVCVIPYALDLRAQHASPLKLYEYAAASKPIVATDFGAARHFEGHVHIVGNAGEFVAACEEAVDAGPGSDEIEANRRIASENTWWHRIKEISAILQGPKR